MRLGYADYVEMVRATRGWNPDLVAALLRTALNATETGYYAAMRRTLARVDIEQGDGSLADAWYVLRGLGWNAWFEPRRLGACCKATLSGMGLEVTQHAGHHLGSRPASEQVAGRVRRSGSRARATSAWSLLPVAAGMTWRACCTSRVT